MGNCCGTGNGKVEGSLPAPEAIYEVKTIPNRNDHSSATSITKVSVPRTLKSEQDILSCPNLTSFTLSELKNATRNFCPERLIGEGGFGYVFKGWIDEQTIGSTTGGCGMVVAVKKLKPEGFQGHKEWMCEVNFLGQLHHPNLVRLIGYCIEDYYRLLVYEFMPKGSLEKHLFKRRGGQPLSWATRIKVAMGTARGLSFLHECNQQVIYRDFKASNVLLDSEFNARLSDFGLARAGPTGNKTHVSTKIVGTCGYAAPEYIATGRLTTRCDVYSFGVVLLELLTGRRVFDKTKVGLEQNLIDWAKPYLGEKRKIYRIMDLKMEGQYPQRAAFLVGRLALQCVNEAKHRPSMSEVVAVLEDDIIQKTAYNHSESHRNRAFFSEQNTPCRPVSKSPLIYSENSPIYMTAKGSPLQPHRRTPSI